MYKKFGYSVYRQVLGYYSGEEDAYGEGEHSYYNSPSLTEASVAALVMKHVNRLNGLSGSFDYITNIEVIESPFNTPDHPTWRGGAEDLIEEIEDLREYNKNLVA